MSFIETYRRVSDSQLGHSLSACQSIARAGDHCEKNTQVEARHGRSKDSSVFS